jgi:hypothetical protein
MFPGGSGIPVPPPPPPGMTYGEMMTRQKEIQKEEAARAAGYSKEAAENQKIYLDLGHIKDVLLRGLSTGRLAPAMNDLANIAHQLGADWAIPKGVAPVDAAIFNKTATDLVFAAVKKLTGQVKVAEITGYERANPNITLPVETNFNIINDVLSAGKWQDARAKLANEFVTRYPGTTLAAFDSRFNEMVPLSQVTEHYRQQLSALGAQMPSRSSSSEPPKPRTPDAIIGGKKYYRFGPNDWRVEGP